MGRQVDPMNLGQNHSQCVWKYKIIIPKEEPKQENRIDTCYNFNKEIGCVQAECRCEQEEPKQETLEEFIESYVNRIDRSEDGLVEKCLEDGAKWQAERMYSEEEVIKIVETSRITGLTAEYLIERFKNLKRYSPHMPIIASNPNKTNQPTTNEENNI
jgi:hypothetical protein